MAELANSITEHGVIQPLIVARAPQPGRYQLVAGERRWQAARLAGLRRVPVVVKDVTPQASLELALIENIQRADLNPLEEAIAYRQLMTEFGLTQEETARRIGRSRVAVANTVRLLNLPEPAQQALADGAITEGHARALLGLPDADLIADGVKAVVSRALSVRQIEEWVRRRQPAAEPPAAPTRPNRSDGATDRLVTEFQNALGTRVELARAGAGGRLVIHFYSEEELQALYDRIVLGVRAGADDDDG